VHGYELGHAAVEVQTLYASARGELGETLTAVGIFVVMVSLEGDHDCPIAFLPFGYACADFFHDPRKLVTEGDFFEDELVARMVKPGVKVGTADSAIGYANQDFVFSRFGNVGFLQACGSRFLGVSSECFHADIKRFQA
jgi:hypothetical protein